MGFLGEKIIGDFTALEILIALALVIIALRVLRWATRRRSRGADYMIRMTCPTCGWTGVVSKYAPQCPSCGERL